MKQETKNASNGELVTMSDSGRFIDALGNYGYRAHFSGAYICYTDGHVCDCAGE